MSRSLWRPPEVDSRPRRFLSSTMGSGRRGSAAGRRGRVRRSRLAQAIRRGLRLACRAAASHSSAEHGGGRRLSGVPCQRSCRQELPRPGRVGPGGHSRHRQRDWKHAGGTQPPPAAGPVRHERDGCRVLRATVEDLPTLETVGLAGIAIGWLSRWRLHAALRRRKAENEQRAFLAHL